MNNKSPSEDASKTSVSVDIKAIDIRDKENPSLVSSGDREVPTRGSIVPVGNQASLSFPAERLTQGLEFPGSTAHK